MNHQATIEEYAKFCQKCNDCLNCRLWEICPASSAVEHNDEEMGPCNWETHAISQLIKMTDEEYLRYSLEEFEVDKREVEYKDEDWRLNRMDTRLSAIKPDCRFFGDVDIVRRKLTDDLWEDNFESRNLDYLVEYVEVEIKKILEKLAKEAQHE